jgi:hypothetical protein
MNTSNVTRSLVLQTESDMNLHCIALTNAGAVAMVAEGDVLDELVRKGGLLVQVLRE